MKKRVLSVLLSMMLLFTSADFTAFATDQTDVVESTLEEDSGNKETSSITTTGTENSNEESFSTEIGTEEAKTIAETKETETVIETETMTEMEETETVIRTETITETEETETEIKVEDEKNLEASEGDFTYTVSGDNATITGYTGNGSVVVIPSTLDDATVTEIGNSAFSGCTTIKSITLPDTIKSIGNSAFYGCSSLKNLVLPETLTFIGCGVIAGTAIESITIPKNVKTCGSRYSLNNGGYGHDGALADCETLQEVVFEDGITVIPSYILASHSYTSYVSKVIIPDSVTSIGDYAFFKNVNLNLTSLPKRVETIGHGAFGGCTKIENMLLPDSITSIGTSAFFNCTGLKSVSMEYNSTVEHTAEIQWSAFSNCTSLENVSLSQNVVTLGDLVFSNCSALKKLDLPKNLTAMGYQVISDTSIESITIPKNMKTSGYNHSYQQSDYEGALAGCKTLNEVIFEEGMTEVPSYILASGYNANYVKKVIIPDSVTSIGDYAFYKNENLNLINIPKRVETIGRGAFKECAKIESISLPDSVTSIGAFAFSGCTSLKNIRLSENVVTLGSYAFEYCSALTKLELPKNMTAMGHCVISDTSIERITIPKNMKTSSYDCALVGEYYGALADCKTLKEVTFEEGMTEIPSYILASGNFTSYVNKIVIPVSVTSIGDYAFYDCNNLADIYYAGDEKQWKKIKIGSYNDVLKNATIHYNSTGPKEGFCFSATTPTTCIKVGETLGFDVQYYEKDVFDTSIEDVIYVVSDNNVMDVAPGNWDNTKGKHYTVKAKSAGYSTITFTNPNNGKAGVLEFYVVEKETGYALDNVPKFTVEKSKTTNFFNYSGLVVDELQYIPCKDSNGNIEYYYVTMDVYNTFDLYAVVTSYDCNGNLKGFYIVDKMKTQPSNLTGNVKDAYYNIGDLFHLMGNKQYYSGKSISKKTEVEINVPVGGYIEISNSAMSETVVLTNMVGLIVDSMASSGEFVTGAYDFSESETEIIKAVLLEVFSDKNLAKMITKSIKKSAIDELKHGNWNYSNYGECLNAFMDRLTNLGIDLVDIIADKVASVTGLSSITESVVMRCIPTGDLINFLYDTLGVLDSLNMWDSYIQSVNFPRGIYIYAPSADNTLISNGVKVTPTGESKSNTVIHAYLVLDTSEISGSKYQTYNINMYRDGQKIQPNAPVAVQIPIPVGYSKTNIKVYRLNDDGTITDMEATVIDGYISFTTEHFSYYALVSGDKGGVFLSDWKFGDKSTITLSTQGEQLKGSIVVYAASYNKDGKMLDIVSGDDFINNGSELQVIFNHQLTKDWELFILDSATYAPLCPSITFPSAKR